MIMIDHNQIRCWDGGDGMIRLVKAPGAPVCVKGGLFITCDLGDSVLILL